MKIISLLFALLVSFNSINSVSADSVSSEIDHLIAYVSASGCSFIRNDSSHPASEAVEHMTKKYRYFSKRINSAEEFIEFSASKSTLSGEPYWIKCPGTKEQQSREWLLEELQRYRQEVKTATHH
ncbi:DUF5329 domain-containing protein [Endozoicomonas sp. SCSIO W0465]|uniref:DUF5329 family protein n=1 Tax=Endozoicomonas sp. SCSIO W0465 TaxID=2918516 RepID=UPI0020765335|nr:DUF5329 domain-containing protein [Endozoicomonas sp. SCSIO W0465]USE36108.1 DUF5329 domain-containing protein [Endozoicomonas sp. SCSIO W0465]